MDVVRVFIHLLLRFLSIFRMRWCVQSTANKHTTVSLDAERGAKENAMNEENTIVYCMNLSLCVHLPFGNMALYLQLWIIIGKKTSVLQFFSWKLIWACVRIMFSILCTTVIDDDKRLIKASCVGLYVVYLLTLHKVIETKLKFCLHPSLSSI